MTEPKIIWYWDWKMLAPDDLAFHWTPATFGPDIYVVKCVSSVGNAKWNVVRVMFDAHTEDQIQQTMDTLLDVCRMRYADELLNQGEIK